MNLIQTLYINNVKDPFRDSFGWAAPEYHLMGWALGCLQLNKIYGNITLYVNTPAAGLLIDTLQLPYVKVNITHDQLTLIHPDLWALPKIYTYSLQEQPFLHIDGDAFLFSPFDSDLLQGELIAQNVEMATDFYYSTQKGLIRYFTFFPSCVKKDFDSGIPVQAVNAGILGGNNLSFFQDYTTLAFEYIHKNSDNLKNVNVNLFNVFFEQHLFYALAKEKGIEVKVIFNGIIKDDEYKNAGDFHDVPFNKSYLHLLGAYKRDEFTCIQMATKLRELYPDYYDRIVKLFHDKNIRLSPCGFYNGMNPFDEKDNSHLQLLKHIADNCPSEIEKESFRSDCESFYLKLVSLLRKKDSIASLSERDLSVQHWYRYLFADLSGILDKTIVRSRETEIIESSFNWAGLFNKYYRVGTGYYSDLQISKGQFFNLVVYEASDNGFSLYDMDEIDHALLSSLSEPASVNELLNNMKVYFDDDVLLNHYDAYENLIFTSLKQLVIKKAIRPSSYK